MSSGTAVRTETDPELGYRGVTGVARMNSAVVAALVTGGFALVVALYSAGSSHRRERRLRELGFDYDNLLEFHKSELSRVTQHIRREPSMSIVPG